MTRTQETESGLCHRPRERARLPFTREADHLAVKSVKQSCLSSSAEALVRWGPRQDKKKRYQRCGHDDDRRAHSHTHTDGHIMGKQHRVLIMTSPMCHTIPGQHRQFAGRGVPQAALVRLILVVEVVLPAPERCDLESRSSLVKPAYSPSKTSPVLPGGRATTRAGCLVPIAVVVGYCALTVRSLADSALSLCHSSGQRSPVLASLVPCTQPCTLAPRPTNVPQRACAH